MKIKNIKYKFASSIKNYFIKISILFLFLTTTISAASTSNANVNVYISDEVGGATLQDRINVDVLDDVWRVAASNASSTASTTFFNGNFNTPTSMTVNASNTIFNIGISLQNMTSVLDVNNVGTANTTQGNLVSNSLDMQDSSPKPQTLVSQNYWNEQAGSTANRNGLKITFSTGVRSAGLYIGDFESRTGGGGTSGLVRLYDISGNFISENVINPNGNTNQSLCGAPVNDAFVGCGNRTTRHIGFVADQNTLVGSMILIVGDDDTSSGTDNGNTEHFSFTGLTVAEYITKTIEPVATTTPTTTPATSTPTTTPATTTEPIITSATTASSTPSISTTTPTTTPATTIPIATTTPTTTILFATTTPSTTPATTTVPIATTTSATITVSTPTATVPTASNTVPTTTPTTTISIATTTPIVNTPGIITRPNYSLAPLGLIDPNIYSVNTDVINTYKKIENTKTQKLSSLLPVPPRGYEYCNDDKNDCIDAESVFKKVENKKLEQGQENIKKGIKTLPETGDGFLGLFNIYNYDNFQDVYIVLSFSILIILSRLKYLIKV